jgi:hypothetical protein
MTATSAGVSATTAIDGAGEPLARRWSIGDGIDHFDHSGGPNIVRDYGDPR